MPASPLTRKSRQAGAAETIFSRATIFTTRPAEAARTLVAGEDESVTGLGQHRRLDHETRLPDHQIAEPVDAVELRGVAGEDPRDLPAAPFEACLGAERAGCCRHGPAAGLVLETDGEVVAARTLDREDLVEKRRFV